MKLLDRLLQLLLVTTFLQLILQTTITITTATTPQDSHNDKVLTCVVDENTVEDVELRDSSSPPSTTTTATTGTGTTTTKKLRCTFQIEMTVEENNDNQPHKQLEIMKNCLEDGTCVTATIDVINSSPPSTSLPSDDDDTSSPKTMNTNDNINNDDDNDLTSEQQQQDLLQREQQSETIDPEGPIGDPTQRISTKSSASSSSSSSSSFDGTIHVRDATYQRPYDQYGDDVAVALTNTPKIYLLNPIIRDNNNKNYVLPKYPNINHGVITEVVNFLLQLGNAHLELDKTQPDLTQQMGVGYQMTLALNAFHAAIDLLEDDSSSSTSTTTMPGYVREEYLASIHYRIGEAYVGNSQSDNSGVRLDPVVVESALEHYTIAQSLFGTLRTTHPTSQLWMDKGYADCCTKIAMTKLMTVGGGAGAANGGIVTNAFGGGDTLLYGEDGTVDLSSILQGVDMGMGEGGLGGISQEELIQLLQEQLGNLAGGDGSSGIGGIFGDKDAQGKIKSDLNDILDLFDVAIGSYTKHLEPKASRQFMMLSMIEKQDYFASLAMAYHQAGTAATSLNELVRAKEYTSNALRIHLTYVLPTFENAGGNVNTDGDRRSNFMKQSSKISIGTMYLTIANICTQLGDYDCAKSYYQLAMEWYDDNDLDVPAMSSYEALGVSGDETLQLYMNQLDEYRRLVAVGESGGATGATNEPYADDGFGGGGGNLFYYERNNAYEGDLLSAIASIHLTNGNIERAIQFYEQSLELYRSDPNTQERAVADTKINLAMAHFQARRFQQSRQIQFEALDTFRDLYGDGVNPYTQGMDDLWEQWGIQQTQEQQRSDVDSGDVNAEKEDTKDGNDNNEPPKIDLESYRASLMNLTTGLDDDDEL